MPAAWSDRRKVVHLCRLRMSKFGYPTVEIVLQPPARPPPCRPRWGLSAPFRAAASRARAGYERVVPALRCRPVSGGRERPERVRRHRGLLAAVRPAYVEDIRRARQQVGNGPTIRLVIHGRRLHLLVMQRWVSGSPAPPPCAVSEKCHDGRPGQLVPVRPLSSPAGRSYLAPVADSSGQPTAVSETALLRR